MPNVTQGQDSSQPLGYAPKYTSRPRNVVRAHCPWHPFRVARRIQLFTSQHPWKVTAPAQKDGGETLCAGNRQGSGAVVYLPLLGTGRGGKDENTRAGASGSALASPRANGDSQEAKYKNNNTKKKKSLEIQQLYISSCCRVVIQPVLCQKWAFSPLYVCLALALQTQSFISSGQLATFTLRLS